MTAITAHATPTVDECVETLEQLYPGRLALLLVPLCSPSKPHKHRGSDGELHDCDKPGKKPVEGGWNLAAVARYKKGDTVESQQRRKKMAAHLARGNNVGWVVPPCVLAIDADTPEAVSHLTQLLPECPQQETGRGWHFIVQAPRDLELITASVKLELAEGIEVDIRAPEKSQLVVDPSTHASGTPYCWKIPLPENLEELPECPPSIADKLRSGPKSSAAKGTGKFCEGQRNDYLFRLACRWRARGLSEPEIRKELHRENARHCDRPLEAAEVENIVQSCLRYPAGGPASAHNLPTIIAAPRQLRDVSDEALSALVAANEPPRLFQRKGRTVRIANDEEGEPSIELLGVDAMTGELTRCANFKNTSKNNEAKDTAPPPVVARDLLARTDLSFPPLEGITRVPVLRVDGSLFDSPGYDTVTRLFYCAPAWFRLPNIPERPGRDEIVAARELIAEAFCNFPFKSDADRATAVAGLITPLVRSAIEGETPLSLFDAPQAGTGKGLAAKVVTVVATGKVGPFMAAPGRQDDAEWQKRITSMLLTGTPVCIIDNVEGVLRAPSLSVLLTTTTWVDRHLGHNEMLHLPARTTWYTTGNNLKVGGDVERRSVWCRMDAKMARPWQRDEKGFKHPDLLGWVKGKRAELVAAVLTLARGWVAAGKPGPDATVPPFGSFEAWRHVVGGILKVAEVPGFLGNLEELYEAVDEDTPQWAAFLDAWFGLYAKRPMLVADVARDLEGAESEMPESPKRALLDALPLELADERKDPGRPGRFTRKLGAAIGKRVDRRYKVGDELELRFARAKKSERSKRAQRWRVLTQDDAEDGD